MIKKNRFKVIVQIWKRILKTKTKNLSNFTLLGHNRDFQILDFLRSCRNPEKMPNE